MREGCDEGCAAEGSNRLQSWKGAVFAAKTYSHFTPQKTARCDHLIPGGKRKKKTKKGPLMINLVNFYTVKVSAKAIWVAVTYSVS